MYEVEVKVEATHGPVRERLGALDAEPRGVLSQHDTYYDHPVRSFAETDEALRLRLEWTSAPESSMDSGLGSGRPDSAAMLTYKGPRIDDVSKTRREIKTGVDAADAADDLLRSVGFERAAEVEKRRERFDCSGYEVALDTVAGLGEFVEVETEVGREDVSERRAGAFELVERLGLDPETATRSSYLALLLEAKDAGVDRRSGDGR